MKRGRRQNRKGVRGRCDSWEELGAADGSDKRRWSETRAYMQHQLLCKETKMAQYRAGAHWPPTKENRSVRRIRSCSQHVSTCKRMTGLDDDLSYSKIISLSSPLAISTALATNCALCAPLLYAAVAFNTTARFTNSRTEPSVVTVNVTAEGDGLLT